MSESSQIKFIKSLELKVTVLRLDKIDSELVSFLQLGPIKKFEEKTEGWATENIFEIF